MGRVSEVMEGKREKMFGEDEMRKEKTYWAALRAGAEKRRALGFIPRALAKALGWAFWSAA